MKSFTRLALALIMLSIFSISYLVTSVSAQDVSVDPVTESATPNPGKGISDWVKDGLKSLGIGNGSTGSVPASDASAAPVGDGEEVGGPAAQDMSGNMINDGGQGANSGADAEATMAACMATKTGSPEARADLCR